jgi:N-acetylneuraminic acid mutarotase
VAGRVMIAGGTSGTALSAAIFAFDPKTNRVSRVGSLPAPLTHAAGAGLGGAFYVIGGRTTLLAGQTANILRVDPTSGTVKLAGHLPRPLSDTGAVARGQSVLVAGGRDAAGQASDELLSLDPVQ